MDAAPKQQEIVGYWPIPDMAQQMRLEHDRLAQAGWVYDGYGGYRPKVAISEVAGRDFKIVQGFRRGGRA
jgi:hypothetical protein